MEKSVKFTSKSDGSFYVPLAFRDQKFMAKSTGVVLAGDIGGTKTNLALFNIEEGELQLVKKETFRTKKYKSFLEVVEVFQTAELPAIDAVCLGVAGPVNEGKVLGTNFSWAIDEEEVKNEMNVAAVALINDLEANAYGLAALQKDDFVQIREGAGVAGNAAVVSPGTGLGEAGLYWDGTHYHPFASEGGHCDFSPRNELDLQLWRFLHKKFGNVSWERLLSGPGIYNIYQFLLQHKNIREPDWFQERIQKEDRSAVISDCAAKGSFPVCEETMDLFTAYLAREAAQVALKFKATGGIYIGGGILPKVIELLDMEIFNDNFVQSDRMNSLLKLIPVKAILNSKTPLYGAAYCAAMSLK